MGKGTLFTWWVWQLGIPRFNHRSKDLPWCQKEEEEEKEEKSCINKQDWLEKEGNGSKKCS